MPVSSGSATEKVREHRPVIVTNRLPLDQSARRTAMHGTPAEAHGRSLTCVSNHLIDVVCRQRVGAKPAHNLSELRNCYIALVVRVKYPKGSNHGLWLLHARHLPCNDGQERCRRVAAGERRAR